MSQQHLIESLETLSQENQSLRARLERLTQESHAAVLHEQRLRIAAERMAEKRNIRWDSGVMFPDDVVKRIEDGRLEQLVINAYITDEEVAASRGRAYERAKDDIFYKIAKVISERFPIEERRDEKTLVSRYGVTLYVGAVTGSALV